MKNKGIGNVFSEIVKFGGRHNIHQKPYQMTATIIQQLTNEGDLVVDPCAGSFVSLRACQKLNRNFLGTDLTLRALMNFNLNKERSRLLLKQEKYHA
ncbi:MAG: site-specific DNA-methyltransferase [Mollicutes bacterium UO1]